MAAQQQPSTSSPRDSSSQRPLFDNDLDSLWNDFFSLHRDLLHDALVSDSRSLELDYWLIDRFDGRLARALVEQPDLVLGRAERVARERAELGQRERFNVRVHNLSRADDTTIESIRIEHQGRLVQFDGLAQQATEAMAKMLVGAYECRACGHVQYVTQEDPIEEEKPHGCGMCEKRTSFDLVKDQSVFVDAQKLIVQDLFDRVDVDREPGRIAVWLEDDLAGEIRAGQLVRVVGVVDSEPRIRGSKRTTTRSFYANAVHIQRLEQVEMPEGLSPAEVAEWQALATEEGFTEALAEAVAPGHEGHVMERVALALSLVGGCGRSTQPSNDTRGDIHILMIGDPGEGKSRLLKAAKDLAPGAAFVDAKNASKTGLTASVVRDEWTGRWALDLGAIPLTDRSLCAIDELDKAGKREIAALHEAMEQQTCSVAKAGITAQIPARSTIIAAANPKHGFWDENVVPADQLNLPGTILSRFDLIFPFIDSPDPDKDAALAQAILRKAQGRTHDNRISKDQLRRVISHARQHVHPVLSDEAATVLQTDYLKTRKRHSSGTVAITPRQLEAMVRISQAHARLCLREEATADDARFAVKLMHYWLDRLTSDRFGGGYDITLIEVGHGASQRRRCQSIVKLLDQLQREAREQGHKWVTRNKLVSELENYGGNDSQLEADLALLKKNGDIYEPVPGKIALVKG